MANRVFIASSLDGYIADRTGGLGFLEMIPNPDLSDMGFDALIDSVDAILMGRKTVETVLSFDCPWPYARPVFVLSTTMTEVPKGLEGKVEIVNGSLAEVLEALRSKGHENLYVDGGKVVQSFLAEDSVDDLIITRIPILLGGGVSLFGELPEHLEFEHVKTEVLLGELVQSHYRRKRQ